MHQGRHATRSPGRGRRRQRGFRAAEPRHQPLPLTPEGVPAAVGDAPLTSPVVFVSGASLERYPWLPGRVIAGSVWRGAGHLRVRIDEQGDAQPWRCPAARPV